MSRFVSTPHFPVCCSGLIYGKRYAEFLEAPLQTLRIESILMPDNPDIDPRLAGHADLSLLHLGEQHLAAALYLEGSDLSERLRRAGANLIIPQLPYRREYPFDAQLNLCIAGEKVILNPITAAGEVVDYLTNFGVSDFIFCRQGYTRCAVCLVDREGVITSDRGIAKAMESSGMDILLISQGHIWLEGYPYGFIGGASFKISSERLAFTGRLDRHPDCDRILKFLQKYDIEPIFLTSEPAFDIGSAIPIFEA